MADGFLMFTASFSASSRSCCVSLPIFALRQVAHLYRHSLRCLLSWTIDRDLFNEGAAELRSRFDANRGASLAASSRLLQVR
jgi:hypothetical protein